MERPVKKQGGCQAKSKEGPWSKTPKIRQG